MKSTLFIKPLAASETALARSLVGYAKAEDWIP
jgi:hypothetical protein